MRSIPIYQKVWKFLNKISAPFIKIGKWLDGVFTFLRWAGIIVTLIISGGYFKACKERDTYKNTATHYKHANDSLKVKCKMPEKK